MSTYPVASAMMTNLLKMLTEEVDEMVREETDVKIMSILPKSWCQSDHPTSTIKLEQKDS